MKTLLIETESDLGKTYWIFRIRPIVSLILAMTDLMCMSSDTL